MSEFNLALCQMTVVSDKAANIKKALKMIDDASQSGANMIILPEMFNCPYENSYFPEYAENEDESETLYAIKEAAIRNKVYIIAGSIPEKDEEKIYNTSFIFDKKGSIIAKHRKVHLFDIDVKEKISFHESDILTAGDSITVVDSEFCKIGVAICYDIRFPELIRLMALKGAELILLPAAFNTTTGPAHWDILMRTRALDNQVYLAAASPARNNKASYKAYGHSMIVDPWGRVIGCLSENEDILISSINLEEVRNIREQLPLLKHRRLDIYSLDEL